LGKMLTSKEGIGEKKKNQNVQSLLTTRIGVGKEW